jgi:hypothetical protein
MYLGDGVYASFDGYHIWLYTDVDGQRHSIAFDDQATSNLVMFIDRVRTGVPPEITEPLR